jgi:hypothetical protein
MQYLTIWDLFLTPLYLVVLSAIAKRQRDKRYPHGHPLRPYFLKGLYLKFAGAIFIGLIYQYYYGGGDTFNFFRHSRIINRAFNDSPITWFKLITRQPLEGNPELYEYVIKLFWYNDKASYTVGAIGAIFGLLSGTSYIPIALLFAYFSYTGIWAMYRTFAEVYPRLHKELAIAFLFIPSTFVWGSSIFKDTICMFGLGWMTYTVFRLFINRDFSIRNIFLLALSFYLIYLTKLYILLAFLPALTIWLLTSYSSKLKSIALRTVTKIAFLGVAAIAFFFFTRVFAEEMSRYSLDNIAQTAANTRGWISYVSEQQEGSAYDLGEFDPSIGGMLSKFPQAVVVTLFRPFPWEARKVIVMLTALEALVFVFFTFKAFRKRGLFQTLRLIGKDANLLFFIVFTLIFAFAVGISSYNFGALSRYKIPCLPFFGAFLMVILHYERASSKAPTKPNPVIRHSNRLRKVAS